MSSLILHMRLTLYGVVALAQQPNICIAFWYIIQLANCAAHGASQDAIRAEVSFEYAVHAAN